MASECSIICYFKTKNLKNSGEGHSSFPFPWWDGLCPFPPIPPRHLRRLDPRAFGTCPHCSKILDLQLAPATVLAAAPMSAPSLSAAPATATSTAAVTPAVAWAGSQQSGPWSPEPSQTGSKKYGLVRH